MNDFVFLLGVVLVLVTTGHALCANMQFDSENSVNLTKPLILTYEQEVMYSSHVILDLPNGAREVTKEVVRGCGLTNRFKIIGGSTTLPNEFPWMVYLLITKYNATYMCGGFLVSDRHVITAAHCTVDISHGDVRVVLGDHDRSVSTDSSSVIIRSKRITIHPLFNKPQRNNNDISVITLTESVPLSSVIGPVCLPDTIPLMQNYTGSMATIMGWGKMGISLGESPYNDPASDELRQVQVSIIDDSECRNIYAEISVQITSRMICAGSSPQGGKDSCQGDSGGPLVISARGRYVVVGIASFGFSCASPTFPGVYTKVDRMMDFILHSTSDTETLQSLNLTHQ